MNACLVNDRLRKHATVVPCCRNETVGGKCWKAQAVSGCPLGGRGLGVHVHAPLLHVFLDVRAALLVEPAPDRMHQQAAWACRSTHCMLFAGACHVAWSKHQPWGCQPTQQTAGPGPQNWAQSTARRSGHNMQLLSSAACAVGCCLEVGWRRSAHCNGALCVHTAICKYIQHRWERDQVCCGV